MNPQLKNLGLTPLKGGVMCVLLVLFAVVWGPQLAPLFSGGGSTASVPKAGAAAARRSESPPATAAIRPDAAPRIPKKPTPRAPDRDREREPARSYTAVEAGRYDPFSAPVWAPQPKTQTVEVADAPNETEQLARLEELFETGVAMILVSNGTRVAAIGDRVVRVGDEIDGFRVSKISSDGVLLQPIAPPAPAGRPRDL